MRQVGGDGGEEEEVDLDVHVERTRSTEPMQAAAAPKNDLSPHTTP